MLHEKDLDSKILYMKKILTVRICNEKDPESKDFLNETDHVSKICMKSLQKDFFMKRFLTEYFLKKMILTG